MWKVRLLYDRRTIWLICMQCVESEEDKKARKRKVGDKMPKHVVHIGWPQQHGPSDALLREIEQQRDLDDARAKRQADPAVKQQIRDDAALAKRLAAEEQASTIVHHTESRSTSQAPFAVSDCGYGSL